MKVLTVRQPWAWLIIRGGKDIENRNWPTSYRGTLAIHAAKTMTVDERWECYDFIWKFDRDLATRSRVGAPLVFGAIIGTVNVVDCVEHSDSPWFMGRYGWALADPKPCEPVYVKGKLGLWEWDGKLESE